MDVSCWMQAAASVARLPYDPNLCRPPLTPLNPNTLTPIDATLRKSPEFAAAVAGVHSALARSWAEARAYVKRFEAERAIVEYVRQWDAEGHRAALAARGPAAAGHAARLDLRQVRLLRLPAESIDIFIFF